jgi:hypothetical protein
VWYDPPVPITAASVTANRRCLAMHYKCKIHRCQGTVLLDTGAKGTAYLSRAFCAQNGITIQPPNNPHDTVIVADGSSAPVCGQATVTVQLQSYKGNVTCTVVEMNDSFDMILGDQWLT